MPRRQLFHVLDEVARLDLLEYIARRPRHDARVHGLVVGEAREHQAGEIGHGRAQVTAHLDPVPAFEADIQDRHVRSGERGAGERLVTRRSFAHDLDLIVALEKASDALADQLVVIEQKDADGHLPILPAGHVELGIDGGEEYDALGVPYTRVNDPEKLRRLMGAVLMITADVELTDLLRHLVEEARGLVGARYAALGVLNPARTGLEQFLTVGLSEAEEAQIGDRPVGSRCPRPSHHRAGSLAALPHRRGPRTLRLPGQSSAHDVVPRCPGAGARRGLRQPLPDGQTGRSGLHRRRRGPG